MSRLHRVCPLGIPPTHHSEGATTIKFVLLAKNNF